VSLLGVGELGKQCINLPLLAGLASGNTYEAVTVASPKARVTDAHVASDSPGYVLFI
jgi:hypothetical protein